jgi:hypothetical protein
MKATLARWVMAFGSVWWEFIVGDTPEFAVATLLIIGAALLLRHQRIAATFLLPLLAATFLLTSTLRGRRRAPKDSAPPN